MCVPLGRAVGCWQVARATADRGHFKINSQLGIFGPPGGINLGCSPPGWNGLFLVCPYPEGMTLVGPSLMDKGFPVKGPVAFFRKLPNLSSGARMLAIFCFYDFVFLWHSFLLK